jgi:penicillin amidase
MLKTRTARLVRIANFTIAAAILAVIAVVYWYCWRPLPRRSGRVAAPLAAPASASFDGLGVPHIRAASEQDVLVAQGYVTAQDRLWQMDMLRRFSGGDLAEVLGAPGLEADRESRRLRLRRIAEQAYTTLGQEDRAILAAYARGVNEYIAAHRGSLPVEFSLLGYQPRPWSVVDSLLIWLHMYRDLTTSWPDDISKRALLAAGDAAKVGYLYPVRSGAEPAPGSNAWALSGSHTASGKPLLSCDMHLGWSLPGIWYMVHLQAGDLDVAGVALPGVPGVIVGHNRHIAWGVTNLGFDVQDLYIEKLDERTGRYAFHGGVEQARLERELIQVKGGKPVEISIWVTRHGPVFAEGSDRIALRWAAAEPGPMRLAIMEIDRARNWQEFSAALAQWPGPAQNFVYADVDGNIGYRAAGRLPVRRGYTGDVPVDGESGNFEWQGFIPPGELPSAFNPPGGIIASANQNPFPAGYPYAVNGAFASPYRARQIRDRLAARNGWNAPETLRVQTDVYSAFHHYLALQVVAAYRARGARNPGVEPAVGVLEKWNGQMARDQAAPFIAELVYRHVRTAMAESAAPGKGADYRTPMASVVVENLLRARPAGWFPDYDRMLLSALADAVDEGGRMQGRDIGRWRWGNFMRLAINHPVLHRVPLVGSYFDLRPSPVSGGRTSVKQMTPELGPSMRLNADAGDWDRSLLNIVIGESGQILSPHYRDQWDAYLAGRSFPMQFGKVDARSTLEFTPR